MANPPNPSNQQPALPQFYKIRLAKSDGSSQHIWEAIELAGGVLMKCFNGPEIWMPVFIHGAVLEDAGDGFRKISGGNIGTTVDPNAPK
jgi:hypothetical protein